MVILEKQNIEGSLILAAQSMGGLWYESYQFNRHTDPNLGETQWAQVWTPLVPPVPYRYQDSWLWVGLVGGLNVYLIAFLL